MVTSSPYVPDAIMRESLSTAADTAAPIVLSYLDILKAETVNGRGTGGFAAPKRFVVATPFRSGCVGALAIGDVTGTADADVVVVDFNSVRVFEGDGTGTVKELSTLSTLSSPRCGVGAHIADLDGSPPLDLIVADEDG